MLLAAGTCHIELVRAYTTVCCALCVCCVELQTTGATPLCIAGQKGHVECVRALLDGGAAINQAKVGCGKLDGTAEGCVGPYFWQVVVCGWLRRG